MRTKIFLLISALAFAVSLSFVPTSAAAVGVGKTCGGLIGEKCDDGLWCDPSPGKCGGADIQGKCIKVPTKCSKERIPVCGCDKKTYGNNCERQMAKIQKDHSGRCK